MYINNKIYRAQVEGMTIEETKQELINRINEYFSEIE